MRTATIDELQVRAYEYAKGNGFHDEPCEDGTRIALMHTELSEALEHLRDGVDPAEIIYVKDKHGRNKPDGVVVELADAVIRIMDFCGIHGAPLERAILEKMAYNEGREFRHGRVF